MIPQLARYEYCIKKSIEFLFQESLHEFPFDSDIIINRHKWARLKYSKLAKQLNIQIQDVISAYGSIDGYSTYNGRNYSISYNDTQLPKRIYFTKLHEIGHIYLSHFIDFDETIITRSQISNSQYKILENEANCFARNVIAPAPIVKFLNLDTPEKISKYFQITKGAAKTRLELLNYDYKYISKSNEENLLYLFNISKSNSYCLNCNSTISDSSNFCYICGQNIFKQGDGTMIYKSIELNEKHKAKICPVCENELTDIEGDFCQICGTTIVNKCTNYNCQNLLDGNMRYCPECGSKSTFLEQKFLKNWEIEKVELEQEQLEAEYHQNNSDDIDMLF